MAEHKNNFIPIEEASYEGARFNVVLPNFVDTERIGVNTQAIHRFCRLGGIKHLRVTGNTDGETSSFTPTIVGYDSQGNAYAGKTGIKTIVPTFTQTSDEDGYSELGMYKPHASTWVNTNIDLNLNEITKNIEEEERWQGDLRSTDAWSYYLNKSIKNGLTNAGIKHLVWGFSKSEVFRHAFQYGMMGFFHATFDNGSLESLINRVVIGSTLLNLFDAAVASRNIRDHRVSIFFGPQLDRAAILKILSARTTLVASIKDL
ncbi:MAG: hypothetical protein WCV81_03625 [Microgenomates group bacterium]|jgi:hypothetical protein